MATGDRPLGDARRPWQLQIAELASRLGVDPEVGLTGVDAAARLSAQGPNESGGEDRTTAWVLVVAQFRNMMTLVLAAAAVVTVVIGDLKDAVVIGIIVALNGAVGFGQEFRAERAMEALTRLTGDRAAVRRDGFAVEVAAEAIVPGDVVLLAAGDVVPADIRLAQVRALRVNEAALTGESEPVAKRADPLPDLESSVIGERTNMAFRGTSVTYGRGTGVVVATGGDTELGQVAALLHSRSKAPTPLQRRLAVLARRMAAGALVVCGIVFGVGVARDEPVHTMFLTAVGLAVAAIPEGLPAVVTVALALGARRMSGRNAIIRKLTAVETLGSVNVICTDKTGTLTQNRMVAERVWTPLGQYRVEGQGYEPVGALVPAGARLDDEYLARLGAVAALCNDAVLRPPPSPGGTWQLTGDPTEGALLALAARIGTDPEVISRDWPRIEELAFDAARRRMTTVHLGERGVIVAAKGAVEAVVPVLHVEDRPRAIAAGAVAEQWAREGLRVLALADRHLDRVPTTAEVDLRLVGLVGMADPPRPEAAAAIRECRDAGIEVVMVTGDHAATAKAIAGRMGITVDDEAVMTGDEMQALDDPRLAERIGRIRVFARVDPAQKLRIVDSWHALGAVVAMTGDGVNDAPALRQADIGVAMGAIGTDVSKEAADIVLADDNFATIVHAVEEGRRIYDNIRRTVRYLITTNSGEVWVMFLAPILGLPLPLLPIQILWINLVTDGLPAIALGLQKAEPDTMRRPPRPAAQSLFAQGLWQHALGIGVLMAAVTLPMQAGARAAGWHWQTMVFTTLAFLQLGHALGVRSELRSVLRPRDSANPWLMAAVAGTVGVQLALVYVPALHGVFHTVALRPIEFVIVVTASTAAFFAVELEKWIRRRALPT